MSMIGYFVSITPSQLESLCTEPDTIPDFLDDLPPDAVLLDVDKDWQALHFLLTGDAWQGTPPHAWVVLGGTEVGDDLGYGAAHYLTPQQVAEVAALLSALPSDHLADRYSPTALDAAGVYPQGLWTREPDEGWTSVQKSYKHLTDFYQQAAYQGRAVLKYLE